MDRILSVIGSLPKLVRTCDDDIADRLSHRYTTAILLTFSVIVTSKQFVGDAINCWVPAHFTENHEEYANNFCWVRNTYYQPFDSDVPRSARERDKATIHYYQWVPLILLIQALLFHLPITVWRSLNRKSGIDIANLVECGQTFINTDMQLGRDTLLRYMTKQTDRYLSSHVTSRSHVTLMSRTCCVCCGRLHGSYLITSYIFVKLLFIANIVCQLVALNSLLGRGVHEFGLSVVRSLITSSNWTDPASSVSTHFPRVTLCDFKVRRFANIQQYTVQCVLPINLFNEKIFLFISLWLMFVGIMTVLSLVVWSLRFTFRIDGHRYIKKHLLLLNRFGPTDKRQCKRFIAEYLCSDGLFLLRLVGHNTNAVTVTELVASLWHNYRNKQLDSSSSSSRV